MTMIRKRESDYIYGKRVEDEFMEMLDQLGMTYIKATDKEDRLEGWDLMVVYAPENCSSLIKKRIDVKGVKHRFNLYNWIELVAYSKYKQKLGWVLRGKADYVAFNMIDFYSIVPKKKIKDFVYSKLPLLKKLEDEARTHSNSEEEYEALFLKLINDNWSNFIILDNKEDKDSVMYDVLYSRPQYDHEPDLLFRLKAEDLINIAEYKININD